MAWSQNPNEAADAPPVFYHSNAKTEQEIRAEFRQVFDEFMRRREEDEVPDEARVLFRVNSVNSYVELSWGDEEFEVLGKWSYTVWLLPFGELCIDHEDGADHFCQIVKFAVYDMVYDFYYDRYGDEFETMVCQPLCYFWVPEYRDTPEYIIM